MLADLAKSAHAPQPTTLTNISINGRIKGAKMLGQSMVEYI